MNNNKKRKDGAAYRRASQLISLYVKPGKDRRKAGKRKKKKK